MLNTFVAVLLGNAVVATLFALGVVLLARWCHKPALLHGLWVVVFLKLVTPPMVTIPVPVEVAGLAPESALPAPVARDSVPIPLAEEAISSDLPASPASVVNPTIMIEAPPEPMDWIEGSEVPRPMAELALPRESTKDEGLESPSNALVRVSENSPAESDAAAGAVGFPAASPLIEEQTAISQPFGGLTWRHGAWVLLTVWALGAVVVFILLAREVLRFERSLAQARPADEKLRGWVSRLAARTGLSQAPAVYLLPGTVSPMLWGFGWRPRLLLPEKLLAQLNEDAGETLILHELAHLRRGDHWVRVLEILCQCIYWWHPVVWWGRRQLRIVEEECCDAFVVEHCQGGVYARALLATVDFLSKSPIVMPPAASGMGHLEFLKRRLTMIMQGGVSARLAGLPKFLLLTAAVVGLSVLPRFVAQTAAAQPPASDADVEEKPEETTPATPKNPLPRSATTLIIGQEPLDFEKAPKGYPVPQLEVRDLEFSPDGKLLAAGYGRWDSAGEIVVYDFAAKQVLKRYPVPKGVATVTFSPDGKYLAASYWNTHIEVRDTQTWEVVAEKSTGAKITRLDFSPDGKYLAAASEAGLLTMWTVGDWENERPFTGELFRFQKVVFSPDGKWLVAVGGEFNTPRFGRGLVFEVESGKQVAKIESTGAVFAGVAFSPDSKEFVTGEFGSNVTFWEPKTGKSLGTLSLPGTVRELKYHSVGRVAAACGDNQVYLIKDRAIERSLAGHEREALSVAFSPDGKTLVTGAEDAVIRIWNPETGVPLGTLRPVDVLEDKQEAVLAIAHSPNGQFVVTTHEDGSVRLREAITGTFLRRLEGHEDVVSAVAFSPDSKTLATGSYDQSVKLWNVETGELLRDLDGHSNWVFSVAFSPDGKALASGGYDKTIQLWNIADGKSLGVLEGHAAAVRSLVFSPDGQQLVSGSSDRTVRVWDLPARKTVHELKGHTAAVRAVDFAPDGSRIASGSEDMTIRFWNPKTGEMQQELKGHTGMVWALEFSPRGRTLASGGFDNTLRIWNTSTGASLQTLNGHQDVITSLSYAPNSSAIVTGSYDKTLKLWPAVDPPIPALASLNIGDGSETPNVRFVVFTPDGKRMITGNQNRQIRLWDLATGRVMKTVLQPRGISRGMLAAEGKLLATAGYGGASYLFKAETLELLATFDSETKDNTTVALSPDGKTLVSGAWDGSITVWNVETREKVLELPQQLLPVEGLAFSPDGKLLVSGTGNYKEHQKPGTIKLWDTATWKEVADLRGPTQKIRPVQFSPNGKLLIAGGSQSELLVYDVASQKLLRRIPFGTEVASAAFLPDSRHAVLGGWDGRVELWDVETATRTVRYEGHRPANQNHRYIFDVGAAVDGSVVASAGGDGHLNLWPATSLPPVAPLLTLENDDSEAFHVIMSPDGSRFVVARSNKTIDIIDTKTGKVLKTISGLNTSCSGLAFAPDGQTFAGGMLGGKVFIWNAETGEEVLSTEGHTGGTRRVAFSPDGKLLASGGWDETVAVWNVADGHLRYRTNKQGLAISDVKFSPEGKLLIASTGSWREPGKPGTILVWKADDGTYFRKIDQHGGEIKGLALNPGGRFLVSFGGNGAKVWNRSSSQLIKAIATGITATSAEFAPDGNTLFVCTAGGDVLSFDMRTGQMQQTFEGHTALVHSMAISTDGSLMASASKDGTVKLWPASRVPAIALQYQLQDDTIETFCVAYSPDGSLIAFGGKDKTISLIDAKTKEPIRELSGHNGLVFRLAFTPNSKSLLSASSDGTVRLWDPSTGNELVKWTAHGEKLADVRSIAISPDGKRIAAGNWEGESFVWDLETRNELFRLPKQSLPVTGIAFAPDGNLLATSTGNWKSANTPGELKLWDMKSREAIASLEGHTMEIKGVLFDAKGETLISYGTDKTVRFWDVATQKLIRRYDHDRTVICAAVRGNQLALGDFQGGLLLMDLRQDGLPLRTGGHFHQVASIAFAPESAEFASVGFDGFFKIWSSQTPSLAIEQLAAQGQNKSTLLAEMIRNWQPLTSVERETGKMVRSKILKPHGAKVWFAVYSLDGKILATGGDDTTVKVWNAQTWELLHTLEGHESFTSHAAFSPDGQKLATVSWDLDKSVKLWDVATGKLLASAKTHEAGCRRVAFSPDGQLIATACEDHRVRLFTPQLALSQSLDLGLNVSSVAFSPDGKTLAVGTGNWRDKKLGRITLFNSDDGKKLKELEKSEGLVFHLQFLNDGKRLLAANAGSGCAVWNIETGLLEENYRSEKDTRWVEISRDEKRVIASSQIGVVTLWKRHQAEPVTSFRASEKFIHCATFSPDGKSILVGDEAGELSRWELQKSSQTQVAESAPAADH